MDVPQITSHDLAELKKFFEAAGIAVSEAQLSFVLGLCMGFLLKRLKSAS